MGRSTKRPVRRVALIKAHMRRRDKWIEITIGNVSATGLMAKCAKPPAPGTEVEIRRRGLVIHGRVVWSTATRFGMASAEPIAVAELIAGSGLELQSAGAEPVSNPPWHWRRAR